MVVTQAAHSLASRPVRSLMGVVLMVAGVLILRYAHPIAGWLPQQWENMPGWFYRRPPRGSRRERFDDRFRVMFLAVFGVAWILTG